MRVIYLVLSLLFSAALYANPISDIHVYRIWLQPEIQGIRLVFKGTDIPSSDRRGNPPRVDPEVTLYATPTNPRSVKLQVGGETFTDFQITDWESTDGFRLSALFHSRDVARVKKMIGVYSGNQEGSIFLKHYQSPAAPQVHHFFDFQIYDLSTTGEWVARMSINIPHAISLPGQVPAEGSSGLDWEALEGPAPAPATLPSRPRPKPIVPTPSSRFEDL